MTDREFWDSLTKEQQEHCSNHPALAIIKKLSGTITEEPQGRSVVPFGVTTHGDIAAVGSGSVFIVGRNKIDDGWQR